MGKMVHVEAPVCLSGFLPSTERVHAARGKIERHWHESLRLVASGAS